MHSTAARLADADRAAFADYLADPSAGARVDWSVLATTADAALNAEQVASRSAGVCSVCGLDELQPWQLDDSARCLACQP